MLAKIQQFVKKYKSDIILIVTVILISLLSFAVGYIIAKNESKEPIKIEKNESYEEFTNACRSYTRW